MPGDFEYKKFSCLILGADLSASAVQEFCPRWQYPRVVEFGVADIRTLGGRITTATKRCPDPSEIVTGPWGESSPRRRASDTTRTYGPRRSNRSGRNVRIGSGHATKTRLRKSGIAIGSNENSSGFDFPSPRRAAPSGIRTANVTAFCSNCLIAVSADDGGRRGLSDLPRTRCANWKTNKWFWGVSEKIPGPTTLIYDLEIYTQCKQIINEKKDLQLVQRHPK